MGIIFLQFLQLGTTQPSPERFKKLNTWTFIEILCGGAHVLAACAGKLLIEYVRTAPNKYCSHIYKTFASTKVQRSLR